MLTGQYLKIQFQRDMVVKSVIRSGVGIEIELDAPYPSCMQLMLAKSW